jgi:hypothetical protein
LSPQSTKYESFEDILISNNFIHNIKTFEKLIEFKDSFVKNGFYSKNFEEIKELRSRSFGSVFEVKKKRRHHIRSFWEIIQIYFENRRRSWEQTTQSNKKNGLRFSQ